MALLRPRLYADSRRGGKGCRDGRARPLIREYQHPYEGAEERSRKAHGRGLTDEELRRIMRRYPGDLPDGGHAPAREERQRDGPRERPTPSHPSQTRGRRPRPSRSAVVKGVQHEGMAAPQRARAPCLARPARTGQQGGHWVVRFVARNAGKRPITVIEAGERTPRGGRTKLPQTVGSSIGRVLGEQDQAEMFAGLRKFAAEHASKGPYVALWFQDADLHYHEAKLRTRELDRWARSDHAEPANREPILLTRMGHSVRDPDVD